MNRTEELTTLYLKLAQDLADWRGKNPGAEPKTEDAPIVWRLHESTKNLSFDVTKEDPPPNEDEKAKGLFNKILSDNGIATTLDKDEAWRIVILMRRQFFKPMRPYEPPTTTSAW